MTLPLLEEDGSTRNLTKGVAMKAFFDTNIHRQGYRYVRLYKNCWGEDLPLIGLSAGWAIATVAEKYSGTGDVLVRLHGCFADPYLGPLRNLEWRVHPDFVVKRKVFSVKTDLSLVVVRWKDYWPDNWQQQRKGRSYNVLNEKLINDVLHGDGSFREFLGSKANYEVVTIFVQTSSDLNTIDMFTLSKSLRGKEKGALYFLWPTQKETFHKDGMVDAAAFRSLMHRMEAAHIKTCWPHTAALYFDLVSKSWVPRQCQNLDFKLPPTTLVSKNNLQPGQEAEQAAAAIDRLRMLSELRGGTPEKRENYRGVVKLGFCCKGQGVLPFVGEDSLRNALTHLLRGASPDAHCLVQERVAGVVCEMRAFCCQDMVNGAYAVKLVTMKMKKPQHRGRDETFCLADSEAMTPQAVEKCFQGDMKVEDIREKVRILANQWLNWIQETYSAPQCTRLDFLISRQSDSFRVHTCAIKECGGSTCGLDVCPRTVAVANRAAECIEGFPKPLPLGSQDGWYRHQCRLHRSKQQQISKSQVRRHQDLRPLLLCWLHLALQYLSRKPWCNGLSRKVGGIHTLLLQSLAVTLGLHVVRQRLSDWWPRVRQVNEK